MKKRRKQYRGTKLMSIVILFSAIVVLGVLSIFLPKPTISETEKRELAKMPELTKETLFSGSFARDFEKFYADTFPFRDQFVEMSGKITGLHGVRYDDVRIVNTTPTPAADETETEKVDEPKEEVKKEEVESEEVKSELPQKSDLPVKADKEEAADTDVPAAEDTQEKAPAEENEAVKEDTPPEETVQEEPEEEEPMFELERSGPVFIYGDRAFEIYGGNMSTAEAYANVINAYDAALPDGVQLYSMVVPTSVEVSLPKKYEDSSQPQKPIIDHIYETLADDIKTVDVHSAVSEHKKEYIYFRTDHHWTGLGAYYGYTAFAAAAGFEPLDYDSYEKGVIEGFLGTLYAATKDEKLGQNPDYVEYCHVPVENQSVMYEKKAQTTPLASSVLATFAKGANAYSVYLHGDYPRFDIDNLESDSGRNVLVIKESYGNAFAPYLVPHFDNTYVVDLRYYKLNILDLIEEKNITDVVIVNNAFAVATKKHINSLEALLTY